MYIKEKHVAAVYIQPFAHLCAAAWHIAVDSPPNAE